MKLSISNIAWKKEWDLEVYELMQKYGFEGLEIAPTRVIPVNPYDKNESIGAFSKQLKETYNLEISSMQSIWYGRTENLFRSETDRKILEEYTKKAVLFAEKAECKNLVFGCPKNRNNEYGKNVVETERFFRNIGEFAYQHNTCFSIEPNPVIYKTNFLNTTRETFELVKKMGQKGLKVNVDFGTIIENKEDLRDLDFSYINHIHISEPFLKPIKKRTIHKELFEMAKDYKYNSYISIEMGQVNEIYELEKVMDYISSINT